MSPLTIMFGLGAMLPILASSEIRTARDMNRLPFGGPVSNVLFSLSGVITRVWGEKEPTLIVRDATGSTPIHFSRDAHPDPGDIITISGHTQIDKRLRNWPYSDRIEIIDKATLQPPVQTTVPDILSGRHDYEKVCVQGTVVDIFEDDVEKDCPHIVLRSDDRTITVYSNVHQTREFTGHLIGAEVSVTGYCDPCTGDWRTYQGYGICTTDETDIRIVTPAPNDPFDAEPLGLVLRGDANGIVTLDRKSVDGTVIATWGADRLLLDTPRHGCVEVELARGTPLPAVGDAILVVGSPGTNLFTIDFANAIWRPMHGTEVAEKTATDISANLLMPEADRRHRFLAIWNGRSVRIQGLIRGITTAEPTEAKIYLESDGRILPIDISSCPAAADGVDIGCRVEITGICRMETDAWRPNNPLPRIRGFTVIVRTPKDIRVLARPPWWTPARLMAVIATLLLVILASLVWIRTMRRLVNRRSRQLARERVARAEADLRRDERTRLAVELHDSLSQNLAGLACQFAAMRSMSEGEPNPLSSQLSQAEAMLASSRIELKRCLHDLRNETLDCRTFGDAIRRSVSVPDGTKLLVRFNVPISRVSDILAHSALSILRELVSNATVHGRARNIRIAGSVQDGALSFSVRDDGVGFHPEEAPGITFGHFGLEGIRERVARNAGRFTLESKPGGGCTARVDFPLPDA